MMEHMSQADWVGTPILGPLLERRAMEEDVSWTIHLTQGETEQEMRRRWLEYHLQVQRGRCAYCGVGIEIFRRDGNAELRATVDHIIPLSEGGPDRVENTLGACRRCNYAKRSMALEAFLVSPEFQESVRLNHPCPDRLCGDVVSPDFHLDLLRRGVRVWIDGTEFRRVYAYDVPAGVAEIAVATTKTRSGRPMTFRKRGVILPLFRDVHHALERIETGAFRGELTAWLAAREIPPAVRVRNARLDG